MSKIEQLKKKIAERGEVNKALLNQFAATLETEVSNRVSKSAQAELVNKSNELVGEVKSLLENHDNGLERVVKYLEQKEKESTAQQGKIDEGYNRILHSLNSLAKKTLKVSVTNQDTKFVDALNEGMVKLHNVFSDVNELPDGGSIQYNSMGKISQITEQFEGYRLTTSLRYTDGKVSGWTTKKI
jgi:seryl-tRNA synthetase